MVTVPEARLTAMEKRIVSTVSYCFIPYRIFTSCAIDCLGEDSKEIMDEPQGTRIYPVSEWKGFGLWDHEEDGNKRRKGEGKAEHSWRNEGRLHQYTNAQAVEIVGDANLTRHKTIPRLTQRVFLLSWPFMDLLTCAVLYLHVVLRHLKPQFVYNTNTEIATITLQYFVH